MKKLICLMALVGCGGPDFGPDRAPTQQEQANGESAQQALAAFASDMMNADTLGGLAQSIYGAANGSYTGGMTVAPRGLYADCATVTENRVDFHCNVNGTTLTGFVSRAITGVTKKWHVDLSMTTTSSSTSTMLSTTEHVSGDVTVTGGTQINGSLALDATVHVVSSGHTTDVTMNATVGYNKLVYDPAMACVTGGNIVIQLDAHASQASISQAVRYTFTGCHLFTIAVAK